LDIGLNPNSDIKNILSIYTDTDNVIYIAAYIYRNNLNRSLSVFKVTIDDSKSYLTSEEMVLHNSSDGTYGLNPSIYLNDSEIIVSTKFKDNRNYWKIPKSEFHQTTIKFDTVENSFDLDLSYSISNPNRSIEQNAKAFSSQQDIGSTTYSLNESKVIKYAFQGKVFNTPLVLMMTESHLTEDEDTTNAAAIKKVYGSLGLDGFFSGGQGLRLEILDESIGGTANYTDSSTSNTYYFTNTKKSYGVHKTFEQGSSIGLNYSKSTIPSVLGFYTYYEHDDIAIFDPNLKTRTLTIQSSNDNSTFSSRYRFNYTDYFLNWNVGGGIYKFAVSEAARQQANYHFQQSMSKGSNIGLTANGSLSAGIIAQFRSKSLKGLGVKTELSYDLYSQIYFDNLSQYKERHELPSGKYIPAFRRQESWHGPSIKVGLLF